MTLVFLFFSFFFFFGYTTRHTGYLLISWPGIESVLLALEAWNLNHWTVREVPTLSFLSGSLVDLGVEIRIPSVHFSKFWSQVSHLLMKSTSSYSELCARPWELEWYLYSYCIVCLYPPTNFSPTRTGNSPRHPPPAPWPVSTTW